MLNSLWAKYDRETGQIHPLLCHLIDVTEVAKFMLGNVFSDRLLSRYAAALKLSLIDTRRLLAYWVGLHDLGKASPTFQCKHPQPDAYDVIAQQLGVTAFKPEVPIRHEVVSRFLLREYFEYLPTNIRRVVVESVGGHHGVFHASGSDTQRCNETPQRYVGDAGWRKLQLEVFEVYNALYGQDLPRITTDIKEEDIPFLSFWLAGLLVAADWVGSMNEAFPYAPDTVDYVAYRKVAQELAEKALQKTGWLRRPDVPANFNFRKAFSYIDKRIVPRPVQRVAITLARRFKKPALMIIEAPMGEGKSEAAFAAADILGETLQYQGAYIGMPTQATGDQMFGRYEQYLQQRYCRTFSYHLLHSASRFVPEYAKLRARSVNADGDVGPVAFDWFAGRKRGFFAPFAVGTVDQALMSVLQTKHFFVRLFGLAHKTIIFDEIHGYDIYMSTIFDRLLEWLSYLNSSVVLLSATLPSTRKRDLLTAYAGKQAKCHAGYPAIAATSNGRFYHRVFPSEKKQKLNIEWIASGVASVAGAAIAKVEQGGSLSIICNTIGTAQEVYRTLLNSQKFQDQELMLLHARFPQEERKALEATLLRQVGRDAGRDPKRRLVVVATQVIEQSLDIDFDFMISEFAPADLLLQRAGRLHRFAWLDRPGMLRQPVLTLTRPDITRKKFGFGKSAYVYDSYVLLRSYFVLRGRKSILLPRQIPSIIERTYTRPSPSSHLETWEQRHLAVALETFEKKYEEAITIAKNVVIESPKTGAEVLLAINLNMKDEGTGDARLVAVTRQGDPSVEMLCVYRQLDGQHTLDQEGKIVLDFEKEIPYHMIGSLLGRSIRIAHRGVVNEALDNEVYMLPKAWQECGALRYHKLLTFNGRGQHRLSRFNLILSPKFGLIIHKREG